MTRTRSRIVYEAPVAEPWQTTDDSRDHPNVRNAGSAVLRTPDGRYIVVNGRLWRASRPDLSDAERDRLVVELMNARRAVRDAQDALNASALRRARRKVQSAKVALGERGPLWWTDGAPDYNRHLVRTQHMPTGMSRSERRKACAGLRLLG
jgi:hypothetical protein